MHLVRYSVDGAVRHGVVEGAGVIECAGTPFSGFRRGRRRHPLRQVVLLAPVVPGKIVGVAVNHREDAAARGRPAPDEPALFLKPPSALVGPGDPIVVPAATRRLEVEAELAVVIRRRCRHVAPTRAHEVILGYTCLNDVTARDLLERDGEPTRAKGFDTFCPLGPAVVTDLDPRAVTVETWVNGALRHAVSTKELIFPVEDVVARVSEVMTLLPGDVVATGAGAAVGPVAPGDRVEVRIEGIGVLANGVVGVG